MSNPSQAMMDFADAALRLLLPVVFQIIDYIDNRAEKHNQ